jgi:hypothetical protein
VGPQFAAGAAYTDLGGVSIQPVGNLNRNRIVKPKAGTRDVSSPYLMLVCVGSNKRTQ